MHSFRRIRPVGIISIEFLLVLGLFATLFMLMLGIGRMMNLKQESMHAARYAALAHSVTEAPTSVADIRLAVGDTATNWSISREEHGSDPGNILSRTTGPISSVLAKVVGGSGEVQARYVVKGSSNERILFGLDEIPAVYAYTLPVGYWANNRCGSLSGLLESLGGRLF